MTRKLFILLFGAALSGQANAFCVIDTTPPDGGAPPATYTIPSIVIAIDADQPVSITQPVAQEATSPLGTVISFDQCITGDQYGKNVTNLLGVSLGNNLFATNIKGIAIKPRWNNGSASGNFNSQATMGPFGAGGTDTGRMNYPPESFFHVEFYKTEDTLNLSNPNGDIVLPGGTIAYNWVNSNSLANYAQRLDIGQITIVSTPSCTFDGTRDVDFGLVTSGTLSNGIERTLDFNITCKTDYGHYSATAAIATRTPTLDGNYIKVKDSLNLDDRLRIKISNSNGNQMKVDGSTEEQKLNIASGTSADFNWKATLESASVSDKPSNGIFTAMAEIILQVK
jgi:hypothetical protein